MTLTERYRYTRDAANRPMITTCSLVEETTGRTVAIGYAFCSLSDNTRKKSGKSIARNRAYHALDLKESSLPVHTYLYGYAGEGFEGFEDLYQVFRSIEWKSVYCGEVN